ncbi:MAG: spore maturation protein [Clostridiales bacterium]|nr:spore maturation protein [Clostridiales bacterium]
MGEKLILVATGVIVLRGMLKGVDVYDAFRAGGRQGMDSGLSLLPALCAMTLMLALVNASGLKDVLAGALAPVMRLINLPEEVTPILLLRPLSGSGSLTALQQIFRQCGVDSRAGRVASVLVGSSETIFYTMTVYLGATDIRKLPWALPVSLVSYLVGAAVCGAIVQ